MRVDSISPTRVPAETGAQLLISGRGFRPGVQVSVGGVLNPRTVWVNETVLAVALPAWLPPGPYDVLVIDGAAQRVRLPSAVQVEGAPLVPKASSSTDRETNPSIQAAAAGPPASLPARPGADNVRMPKRKHEPGR